MTVKWFDAKQSQAAADEGMAQALRAERVAEWTRAAKWWIYGLPAGTEFISDDMIAEVGLPDVGANKNNSVGALFGTASRKGFIEWTGELRKSKRVTRHVGLQRVWRRTAK
jgi:hypothetical protein